MLKQAFRNKLQHIRIRTKLMLVFMTLIILLLSVVSFVVYQHTVEILENRVKQATERAMDQASSFLSYKLSNVEDVSSILYMNKELTTALSQGKSDLPLGEQIDDYHRIINILRSAKNSREIYSIRLFVNSDSIYARENMTIFPLGVIEGEDWYREMLTNSEGIYCRSTYEHNYLGERGIQRIVSCIRPLHADGNSSDIVGVLSLDILESTLQQIIMHTQITKQGKVFLVDRSSHVLSSMDEADIGHPLSEVDAGTHMVVNKPIEGTSWKLVAHIPKDEIYGEIKEWSYDLYVILIVVLIVGAVLVAAVSQGLTRRIGPLLQQIKRIESENWDHRTPITSHDEIGVLQAHMNGMGANIQRLIQEKYQSETLKKAAELQALQAQINPHFLYNTLDMIHWMAMERDAEEISEVAVQLSSFFRISLSRGRDIIPIADELEHVRTYLDIQNRRFGGQIQYVIEAEPEVKALMTVKLVLQPFVENALLHGIRERHNKSGCVKISCRMQDGCVSFVIYDNGVGLTPDRVAELNGDMGGEGYGIRNVKEKLKLYFGDEASVTFQSEEHEGTQVTIRFPVAIEEVRWNEKLGGSGSGSDL
ncbi:histidine kinase [Paenibacillus sp. J5C_2022]|uniref:cache domain-containing sensor histidine kinase n=1 Tax=Paenibacillus sp. J5C2022 TaxID=2977129 RepID=UPI0021D1AC58|nr:histidine kinase [Paenibacillus sp. J5C2022]MCU6712254.1 histidine kinase [Paenibacillus sp. J5C2022]